MIQYIKDILLRKSNVLKIFKSTEISTDVISIDEQCATIKRHDIDWSDYVVLYGTAYQDPVRHYVENWQNLKLNIPNFFNVEFYLHLYKDVHKYNASPLQHYLLHGQEQGRYALPSKYRLEVKGKKSFNRKEKDFVLLENFGFDWTDYKAKNQLRSTEDAISHYLEKWQMTKPTFGVFFDTTFYLLKNSDVVGLNPLVHFLRFGRKEGRKGIQRELTGFEIICQAKASDLYLRLNNIGIDWRTLHLHDGSLLTSTDHCAYYCYYWQEKKFVIKNVFDQQLYLELYPDVAAAAADGLNPLEHFWNIGNREGRCAYFDINSFAEKGHVLYDEGKKTIVIVSHTSSKSCSLLVDTAQVHFLSSKFIDYNVIHWVLRRPEVHSTFLENSCLIINGAYRYNESFTQKIIAWMQDNYSIDALMRVSAESVVIYGTDNSLDFNIEALITEFSEYILTEFETIRHAQNSNLYHRLIDFEVDWTTLHLRDGYLLTSSDNCAYYCHYWKEKNFVLGSFFDQKLYLELYPDVAAAGLNPLQHFWNNGRKEGRCAYFDIDSFTEKGHVEYDKAKKTIVIVSHESSATGAPLVGYSLGQHFSNKENSYNVIHWILRKSGIHDAFLENSCLVVTGAYQEGKILTQKILSWLQDNYSVDALISNSAESVLILEAAGDLGINTIALIHEFSEYIRPYGKIARSAMAADRVIVAAEIIKQSLIKDLGKAYGKEPDPGNILVMPQGKIPEFPTNNGQNLSTEALKKKLKLDTGCKLILGAGYVQVRKGVDLFVSLAEKIQNRYQGNCKFVWVGGGYDPKEDMQFSVWLETHINTAELTQDFIFLDHQRTLNNILEITDIFVLPSRLDPFPNVIVDALAANVHVSCFEGATGCAEFMQKHGADASIAKYLDIDDMSDKIIARLQRGDAKKSINSQIVQKYLDFAKYTQNIITILRDIESSTSQRRNIEQGILKSKAFDAEFYGFGMSVEDSVRHYVRAAGKGLNVSNPRPGFSDLRWLSTKKSENSKEETGFRIPFAEAIKENKLATHDCLTLSPEGNSIENNINLKMSYAIHIHLHYPEIAEEFADYVSNLPGYFDIILTFNDEEHVGPIKKLFTECGADKIITATYDNIGRDVAPFIKVMTGIYDQYEVVGHFHSKKSIDNKVGIGDRWRRFLLDTLIGQDHQILEIMHQFEKNPELGLLMAEDRHIVGFTRNKPFADTLCKKLNIVSPETADLYPLGTMFWARTKAIRLLLDLEIDSFLDPEPLPHDGSFMHAIERLIPHFVETSGYRVKTIHMPGKNW